MLADPVYIILTTEEAGGVEKRLSGVWFHFQKRGERGVNLVLPQKLWALLSSMKEFDGAHEYASRVTVIEETGAKIFGALRTRLRAIHRREPRAIFHHVLASPVLVQRFLSRRSVFTIPNSTLRQFNAVGLTLEMLGVLIAGKIDVLDPGICATLKRAFAWKANRITQTPASFVDTTTYFPAENKHNRLVFVGTFNPEKQVHRLVESLATLERKLSEARIDDVEVFILGRENTAPRVDEHVARLGLKMPITVKFESNPSELLASARIGFSLQRTENYPSKALLEALACGCIPIVTDVGETHRIAPSEFAYRVSRDFSSDEIATRCLEILTLSPEEQKRKSAAARSFVEKNFSIDASLDYFRGLYDLATTAR